MSALDDIIARKRADVAEREARLPYEELKRLASPTGRSLERALRRPGARFILECKRKSPSLGLIRADFDISEIARAYDGIADAVSVLTDGPFFGGSFEHLEAARGILDAPILCKDFVLGPYQVCEARVHGADAVLLMLSVLSDGEYAECSREAARLGMDALTEAHGDDELRRAVSLGARIIGINSRNLKDFSVDLSVAKNLASGIPGDRVAVCESGITSRDDVLAMSGCADAFLVGSLLMKSPRVDLAARRLVYGGVKICGLTAPKDAQKSYAAGACFGGLIFAKSPRRVDGIAAREIAGASPLPLVGVFVNEREEAILRLAHELNLAAVQLHGDEKPDFAASLGKSLPSGCEVWKAVRVDGMTPDIGGICADRVLLDTYDENSRGGTGRRFDWSIIRGRADRERMIVAGGITPENAFAASSLGVYAIDVNSGVERAGSPGAKDGEKIDRLFDNLRAASRKEG